MRSLIATITMTLVFAGTALAGTFPFNINTFETYLNGQNGFTPAEYVAYDDSLANSWDVTAIAFEAGDTNTFVDASGTTLFSNADTGGFGTWAQSVDLTTASWYSVTRDNSFALSDSGATATYQLTSDWIVPELNISLGAGSLLFGFNDTGSGDGDFDDLILAATPTAATPIPGAAWLLGSGLVGLIGLRRRATN